MQAKKFNMQNLPTELSGQLCKRILKNVKSVVH